MVKLRDVAEAAGVSTSVASRVLSNDVDARISDVTRSRVQAAAARLNYSPNARSRALRFSRSDAVALVIPDVNNSVFSELLAGVEEAASTAGWSVLLGQMGAPGTERGRLSKLVGKGRVDGVIIQRREDTDDQQLLLALDVEVPVVLFNSVLTGIEGSVLLPDDKAIRIAVDHLVALGHRRVALINGRNTHDAARRRREAAVGALRAYGLAPTAEIEAGWEAPMGRAGMEDVLRSTVQPTAVVVASVNAAVGAASLALSKGVRIPEELSIITIQDTWVAQEFVPSLTAVEMPLRPAGRLAAGLLLNRILDDVPLTAVVAESAPRLVVRSSTAPPISGA